MTLQEFRDMLAAGLDAMAEKEARDYYRDRGTEQGLRWAADFVREHPVPDDEVLAAERNDQPSDYHPDNWKNGNADSEDE